MAMKKRSVDEELKMLQAEAARDLSVSRARVQSEWRWLSGFLGYSPKIRGSAVGMQQVMV